MGAYSRNAAVGLLLCSEKIIWIRQKGGMRRGQMGSSEPMTLKAKLLNVYLYGKYLDSFAIAY